MKEKKYLILLFCLAAVLCLASWMIEKRAGKETEEGQAEGIQTGDTQTEATQSKDAQTVGNIQGQKQQAVTPPKGEEICFSQNGYFFSEAMSLEILSSKPCKIYYTTDGSEPDEKAILYDKPIVFDAEAAEAVTSVKAKAFFEDGKVSDTIIHTYFVGKNISSRYDTLIFSVTTDPYNLYDNEYGIFVEGKLRSEWIKSNPGDVIEPNDPANFNMRGRDSEREVFLEILDADGTNIVAHKAGIRTYGGWSRARAQKSIKMYARKEYDEENNKFRYEFFPWKTAANGSGAALDSFKQLVLRNCGNDNGFAFLRDEVFQTLAGQAGYLDYEAVRPAAMYVNGEYRGFFWLHEVYGDEYFEDNYGKYEGKFEVLEGGDTFKDVDEDGENSAIVDEYIGMYDTYSKLDLTNDTNYQKLCELIDVENYLKYFAFQIYIGNEDWPHNNYRCYRYYKAEGEVYKEAPFDGKWRYMLHDLDFSTGIYGNGPRVDNIQNYVGPNGEVMDTCPLFGQLMRREDCREIFLRQTEDLINGALAPKNFNKVLEEMNTSRKNELNHTYGKELLEDWVEPNQLNYQLGVFKDYMRQRADYVMEKYQKHFKLGSIYTLTIAPAEGTEISVNSFRTKEAFEGEFYDDYPTVISAVLPKGKKLDYWLVNGAKVETEELKITSKDITDSKVEVSCSLK